MLCGGIFNNVKKILSMTSGTLYKRKRGAKHWILLQIFTCKMEQYVPTVIVNLLGDKRVLFCTCSSLTVPCGDYLLNHSTSSRSDFMKSAIKYFSFIFTPFLKQMVERINWMADQSEKGLCQSAGIMVNYVYR